MALGFANLINADDNALAMQMNPADCQIPIEAQGPQRRPR